MQDITSRSHTTSYLNTNSGSKQLTSLGPPYCDKENTLVQTRKAISLSIAFGPQAQGRAVKERDYKSFMLKESVQMATSSHV